MYFSIIVPLYNKAAYIAKTIHSILSQTYPNFEVLIVDDGSTDNSLEVVNAFTDERIKIITQQNKGVSSARNAGINAAQYELIALVDGDDWWDAMYLEEMIGLIKEYPSVSFYTSQFAHVYKGTILPSEEILAKNAKKTACFDGIQMGIALRYLPANASNIIFKKDILRKSGLFDERITYFEDNDILLRISVFSKWAYIEKRPLSFYNKDIPDNHRLTGKKPTIEQHLLFYIDKFEAYYAENPYLQTFLDIFVLESLYDLRYCRNYHTFKREKLKKIPLKKFSYKHIIKYYFPVLFTDTMRRIYLWMRKKPYN